MLRRILLYADRRWLFRDSGWWRERLFLHVRNDEPRVCIARRKSPFAVSYGEALTSGEIWYQISRFGMGRIDVSCRVTCDNAKRQWGKSRLVPVNGRKSDDCRYQITARGAWTGCPSALTHGQHGWKRSGAQTCGTRYCTCTNSKVRRADLRRVGVHVPRWADLCCRSFC